MGIKQTEAEKRDTMWMMARFPFPKNAMSLNKNRVIPPNPDSYKNVLHENIINFKELGILEDVLKDGIKVLEIGCGTGKTLFYLDKHGKGIYYGLEPEGEAYSFISNRLRSGMKIKLCRKTIEEVNFEQGTFNFVYSHHVFEHIENPLEMLEKSKKWLKPDGKIILSCPNIDGFIPKHYGVCNWRLTFPTHVWLPGKSSLFRIFNRVGFEIEKYFTYGGFPAPRNFAKNIANKLFKKFGLGDQIVILARKKR